MTKALIPILLVVLLSGCKAGDPAARRAALHLPEPGFIGNVDKGQRNFVKSCASCHGEKAQGTHQGPSLLAPIYRESHHADLAFHFAVRDGVKQHHWNFGDMPPFQGISPEETEHIIAFIRHEQAHSGTR